MVKGVVCKTTIHRFESGPRLDMEKAFNDRQASQPKEKRLLAKDSRASGGMAYTIDLKSIGPRAVRVQLPPCPYKKSPSRRVKSKDGLIAQLVRALR